MRQARERTCALPELWSVVTPAEATLILRFEDAGARRVQTPTQMAMWMGRPSQHQQTSTNHQRGFFSINSVRPGTSKHTYLVGAPLACKDWWTSLARWLPGTTSLSPWVLGYPRFVLIPRVCRRGTSPRTERRWRGWAPSWRRVNGSSGLSGANRKYTS